MIIWRSHDDAKKRSARVLVARSCAAALFGLLVTVSQDGERALAVSGTVFDWPTLSNRAGNLPAYSRQSGLHVSVDSTWVGDRGYRPVRITFSAAKPVTGDVQITVRFRAGHWRSQTRSILVEQDAELLQGTSSATVTLLVPQYVDWQGCGWEVWVDGKKDEELMLSGIGFGQSNVGGHQYSALALPTWAIGAQPDQSLQRFSGDKIEALAAVDAQLPASWLGYSNLDLVVAFPEDLEQLEKNSPERFEQLLRWVRTGGNLWVFNVGREYGQLAQVNARLGLTNEDGEDQNTPQDKLTGWRALPLRGQPNRGPDALVILDGRKKLESKPAPAVESESLDSVEYVQDSHDWFVARDYGLGAIVAFRKSYSQAWGEDTTVMDVVEMTLLGERLDWRQRHGNWPGSENREFNDLLIPDVGAAPVMEFQLLISLFIIGIGPLNYWLLKRRHQLPLLLVTVPVAAMATTVLLFAYGILSDGFDVRVRARSFTLLDQVNGEATCWARLSYYAGLAPSDGITMADDTAIYPIHPMSSYNQQAYSSEQRELDWGDRQKLARGWLASRTPTQYQTIASRPSAKHLRFERQDETLSVTNELGVDIVSLAVQDHAGSFYLCEAVRAGQEVSLEKSAYIAAMSRLRSTIVENMPTMPAGFVDQQQTGSSWAYSQRFDTFPLSGNLMESQINSLVSPLAEGWGRGTYVAITAAGIELSLGVEDAIESSSFHVVRGIWSDE